MLENWPDAVSTTASVDPYDGSGGPTQTHPEQAIEVPDQEMQDPESQVDSNFAVVHNELGDKDAKSTGDMPPPPVPTRKIRGLAQLGITPEMSEEQIKEAMKARVAHLEHFGINGMYLSISFFKTLKKIYMFQCPGRFPCPSLPFHQATPS